MIPWKQAAIWVFVSTITLIAPLLMISRQLQRRTHYKRRLTAGIIALAAFQLLYVPDGPLSTTESISQELLIQGVLFFSANLVLMLLLVLLCYQASLASAAFCAVVSYTVENLAAAIGNIIGLVLPPVSGDAAFLFMSLRMLAAGAVVYLVFYRSFVAKIRGHGIDIEPSKGIYLFIFAVILFNVIFDIASKRFLSMGLPMAYVLLSRTAVIALCLYTLMLEYEMLFNRHMQAEIATTKQVMRDWRVQYELSQQTIDAINIKCHDIRHQIRHLKDESSGGIAIDSEVLDDIAREVNVYDSTVSTGNRALDTIITEKALLGERNGISINVIADGSALDFMSPADVYSLFGNALENAIEAVGMIEEQGERNVSLTVKRIANMASIHIENYCAGDVVFEDGTPLSTKGDDTNHGFGFKSMRLIVERYGGTLVSGLDGKVFYLDALIPIPV